MNNLNWKKKVPIPHLNLIPSYPAKQKNSGTLKKNSLTSLDCIKPLLSQCLNKTLQDFIGILAADSELHVEMFPLQYK